MDALWVTAVHNNIACQPKKIGWNKIGSLQQAVVLQFVNETWYLPGLVVKIFNPFDPEEGTLRALSPGDELRTDCVNAFVAHFTNEIQQGSHLPLRLLGARI